MHCDLRNAKMSHSITKPTKWHVHLAKTRISLGIAMDPMFLHADSKDWSDWADVQADLSLHCAHRSFCWFCRAVAHKWAANVQACQHIHALLPEHSMSLPKGNFKQRGRPSPVAWSDARPPGIQMAEGSFLRSGKIFFRGDWSWNNFYGHSLPTADSSRAVVSYWRKVVH